MVAIDRVFLHEQAARIRRLAREILDSRAQLALIELATEYEARAAEADVGGVEAASERAYPGQAG